MNIVRRRLSSAILLLTLQLLTSTPTIAESVMNGVAQSECHGKICNTVEEYCSVFSEGCEQCAPICDPASHNYHVDTCAKECPAYGKYEPLKAEILTIRHQQTITIILLSVLLAIVALRYTWRCLRWLRHKRCLTLLLKKLRPADATEHYRGKELTIGATIPNVLAISDLERGAPSQIYSVTGAEGSVMTATTPVSTRYPAENSTPTTMPEEYSYDNKALAITPVSEKPRGSHAF